MEHLNHPLRLALQVGVMLCLFLLCVSASILLYSFASPLPPPYYAVVTAAITNGTNIVESEYSNEISWNNWTNRVRSVRIAWDRSIDPNVNEYFLYSGREPGCYTNRVAMGNTNQGVWEFWPLPTTNIEITVRTTGTNLLVANELTGPWYLLNTNRMTVKNPSLFPVFYRGVGIGSTLTISNWKY